MEFFEFWLVCEVFEECEILLCVMLYISWLMCFVLFYLFEMCFESDMLILCFLGWVMLWMCGCCLVWLIWLGLFFYDNLGGCKILFGMWWLDLLWDFLG